MSQPLIPIPQAGLPLQGCVRHLDQRKIDRFGQVSGGVGAIHLDPEFGRTDTPFGSTLVQGYLLLGYLTQLMKDNFGPPWVSGGTMEARLIRPARAGDTVCTGGHIQEITVPNGSGQLVRCQAWVKNAAGETLVAADTSFLWGGE